MDKGTVNKKSFGTRIKYTWSHECPDLKRTAGSWDTEEAAQKELNAHKEKCGR